MTQRKIVANYLYTCGTLIQVYEERRDGFRIGESCEVTLSYAVLVITGYGDPTPLKGRICVQNKHNRAFMPLARHGSVTATLADIRAGTPWTQKLNLAVQTVRLNVKLSPKPLELEWVEFPTLMGPVVVIDARAEPLAHDRILLGGMWQGYRIAKLTDAREVTPE